MKHIKMLKGVDFETEQDLSDAAKIVLPLFESI